MELPALLDEFGRTAGLGRVALNDEGVCRLVLDEDLTVDVEVAPEASRAAGSFFLHAVAGRLPAGDGDPGLLKELLAANLFGRDTGGATLALDPDLGEVVLLRELGAEATDYGTFAAALTGQEAIELRRWVVGPEGGITERELAALTAAGGVPVRLGTSVVRTSTAGAAAVARDCSD